MAGHSKWANIQHRKGRQDKLRAKVFSKLSKEITIAAKMGEPDPDKNPRLRLAVKEAKGQSMPKDNIERAIKKAVGGEGEDYEEIRYEGYGPGGVALIVEMMHGTLDKPVAHELPFGVLGGVGDTWIIIANNAVQGQGRGDAEACQEFMNPPEPDPHAVFMPRPVGQVRQQRLAHGRRQDRTRLGLGAVPVLDVDDGPHRHAGAIGKLKFGSVDDGRKGHTVLKSRHFFLRSVGRHHNRFLCVAHV